VHFSPFWSFAQGKIWQPRSQQKGCRLAAQSANFPDTEHPIFEGQSDRTCLGDRNVPKIGKC
jgi:hypothetical protein